MPPKTFIVSSYESREFGHEAEPKLPETFAQDVDDALARIAKIGGKVLYVSVVDLKVSLYPPEGSDAEAKGHGSKQSTKDREPRNHLVIIADVPDDFEVSQ